MAQSTARKAVAAVLAGMSLWPGMAMACRCVQRTQAAQAGAADAIIIADVLRGADRDARYRGYTVTVVEGWKARLPITAIVLSDRTDCAADIAKGQRYLLYLRRVAAGYETSTCAGNLPIARAMASISAIRRRYR